MKEPDIHLNNGFGEVASRRGRFALWSAGGLSLLTILTFKLFFYQAAFALSILAFSLGEMMRRLCLFTEEIQHRQTRYAGSWNRLTGATFGFKNIKGFVSLNVCAILLLLNVRFSGEISPIETEYQVVFLLNVGVVPLVIYFFGLREPSRVEESELSERGNKNVADGLAWSYYLGYLRFVLPKLMDQIKLGGERYSNVAPKLYILLPRSCYCCSLVTEMDNRIQVEGSLPKLTVNRGGIPRSFQHTVYKVELEGFWAQYIALEYATPLMSLWDMSQHAEAGLSKEERDEQVVVFYRKIKDILDSNPLCKGKYELIPISGKEANLAEILIRVIRSPKLDIMADHTQET